MSVKDSEPRALSAFALGFRYAYQLSSLVASNLQVIPCPLHKKHVLAFMFSLA